MDIHVRGKRALITGSSAGLGKTIANMLASQGVDLVGPHSDYISGALLRVDGHSAFDTLNESPL